MNELEAALVSIQSDLDQIGVGWALVGGFAVSLLANPRQTRDIDVAVAVRSDTEAQGVIRKLRERGYRERTDDPLVMQTDVDRIATVRLESPAPGHVVVDLLFASSGIEGEIVADSAQLSIAPNTTVPVVRIGHLIAVKILAGRPIDDADARALLREAHDAELAQARAAIDLIERRRYHRGKDLRALLEAAVRAVR